MEDRTEPRQDWTRAERKLLRRVNISRGKGAKVNWQALLTRLPGRAQPAIQSELDRLFKEHPPAKLSKKPRRSPRRSRKTSLDALVGIGACKPEANAVSLTD